MKEVFKDILKALTNRLFISFLLVLGSFYILVYNLFSMQVVNYQKYSSELNKNTIKSIPIAAPRGIILDRFGRALAINKPAFVLKVDRSMFDDVSGKPLIVSGANTSVLADESLRINDLNSVLLELIHLLKENNEKYIDEIPISTTEPYTFLLDGNTKKEVEFKNSFGLDQKLTAPETFKKLRAYFSIPEEWSNEDARDVLSFRYTLYTKRFLQYLPTTIAVDVSPKTVAAIEEESTAFHGVIVEVDSLREYPYGEYVSHMLGYTGEISSAEFETMRNDGYAKNDVVGKTALESAFDKELRGVGGQMKVEVNSLNKKVATISQEDPIQGDKLFLTVDLDLQKKVYGYLKETIKEILIKKITGVAGNHLISTEDVVVGLVKNNVVSFKQVLESSPDSYAYKMKMVIESAFPDVNLADAEQAKAVKNQVIESIRNKELRQSDILVILHEQGVISGDEDYINRIIRGAEGITQVIVSKIEQDELTPEMINLDPSSGSVVVLDMEGRVIAAVNYPSYDNNRLANTIDPEYYSKMINDQTAPMYNRAFSEARAPGSTFKMLSAIAGLESNTITPETRIMDQTVFTAIGTPYPKCWSALSHGNINVSTALEESCNYFFYETGYRMLTNGGNALDILAQFMKDFGLNDKTGVEIGEVNYGIHDPEFRNDPVRTLIGQNLNNYTAATMAKYIETLATRGTRYKMHLLDKIESADGTLISTVEPTVEKELAIKDSSWDSVYDGMLKVIRGSDGTARHVFNGFPITVAGKTGTAQESSSRSDHTSFGGFAPFEKPEIAVYVMIPFGDTKGVPAAASQVARKVFEEYFGFNTAIEATAQENVLVE